MLFTKTIPAGIDIRIQALQQFLYPKLKILLEIDNDTTWDCYGRVYRNQADDGFVPEYFAGGAAGNEYKELFVDDTKGAISFFLVGESTKFDNCGAMSPLSMIWSANLATLFPGNTTRADEELRNAVQMCLQVPRQGFRMTGWDVGKDAAYKEFSGWRNKTGTKFRDMQPLHCFRINGTLLYNINDTYSPYPVKTT